MLDSFVLGPRKWNVRDQHVALQPQSAQRPIGPQVSIDIHRLKHNGRLGRVGELHAQHLRVRKFGVAELLRHDQTHVKKKKHAPSEASREREKSLSGESLKGESGRRSMSQTF
jgi:hypothetical protein